MSGKVVELVGEKVAVAVHGDVDVRVTEVVLDCSWMNTSTDEHGGARPAIIADDAW